mmetsp:Transcript_157762/g.278516  ORF Transcript_157762/g.278516 Transcript_157762/m.278516 type:complete len:320 (+) Transcript_157762:48-1007(+)
MDAEAEAEDSEEMEEAAAGSEDGPRWATQDSGIVWCDSAEALLEAVADGQFQIEIGACEAMEPVLAAVEQVAGQLQSVMFCGCKLNDAAFARIGTALASTRVKGVGISNNPDVGLEAWAALWVRLPASVVKWDFGDNSLPDEALPRLMEALKESKAQELFLDGNQLTNISPLLSLVADSLELTELDLGDNSIPDEQVKRLAEEALPGCSLTTLVLGRNPISDVAGKPLAYALARTDIDTLHLEETQVGDATLDALVDVLTNTKLVELHLDGTKISNDGALRLCKELPQSKITCLDIGDNGLSDETVAAIEAAIPDVTMA